MSQSLCCCSPCRPTFKRHVDGIYPANPEDGLVKNKMETLVYYAVTSPEKLDRIGEYLETRVGRDIYRNRKKNVVIGMEAMDQVGKACASTWTPMLLLISKSLGISMFLASRVEYIQGLAKIWALGCVISASWLPGRAGGRVHAT